MFGISFPLGDWAAANLGVMAVALGLVAMAQRLPMRVAPHRSVPLTAAPLLMAALVLSPAQAAFTATGLLAFGPPASLRARLLNVAASGLAAALASWSFHILWPQGTEMALSPLYFALAALAAVVFYTLVAAWTAAAVLLNNGFAPRLLRRTLWAEDTPAHLASLALGCVGGALALQAWWAALLLAGFLLLAYAASVRIDQCVQASSRRAGQLAARLAELSALQSALIRQAQESSTKTLAQGLAHELNNPLFAISGRAEILLRNADRHLLSEDAREHLTSICASATQAAGVVQRVQSLAVLSADAASTASSGKPAPREKVLTPA